MYFITKLHFPIFPRHLQRFWGASGDFWQALWDRLLDVTGEDPFTFWVYGKDYSVEWCNALFEDPSVSYKQAGTKLPKYECVTRVS